jgi:hypothetical protein
MPHVEYSGDIRRRDYYTEGFFARIRPSGKKILFLPKLIPLILCLLGVIAAGDFRHLLYLSAAYTLRYQLELGRGS